MRQPFRSLSQQSNRQLFGRGFYVVEALERRYLLSTISVIDVLVVYTPAALNAAGSFSALDFRVQRSIAETNMAMANSLINASLRLVGEVEVNYTETGVLQTDLNNIQAGSGAFSGIPALRVQDGADIVSLWVGNGADVAGRGFLPQNPSTPDPTLGYNVVQEQYADNNYVFAHEIGHNLGADEDRADTVTPPTIPYAYGWTWTVGNYTIGDIISDADRVPYYSNPNVDYQGVPTGSPDTGPTPADAAKVMNQFAPIVANYEPKTIPDTSAPLAAVEAVIVNPVAQTLTLKVEYADDTAVSVENLGTGDILITGLNGFSQLATFQSVDFNTDGPQRVATYQVSIAGASQDPSTYTFTLEPNRLQDIYGNIAAGGVLGNPSGESFPNRAGPRLVSSYDAGILDNTTWEISNSVSPDSPTAFYRFELAAQGSFTAVLSNQSNPVNELLVQDKNQDGQIESGDVLAQPYGSGLTPETINMTLTAGTYYMWVAPPVANTTSTYTLTMSDTPTSPPPPSPPSPPPPPPAATIAGDVFNSNSNVAESGISGLPNWTVYIDSNNSGKFVTGDPTATTNSSGYYEFTGLAAGTYTVRVLSQVGWRETPDASDWGQKVTVTTSQNVTGIDFGQTQEGRILGNVFNDANGNGILNYNESNLAGWTVYIDTGNTGSYQSSDPTTTTNALGSFIFDNLAPGTYTVRVVQQPGFSETTPSGGAFQVSLVTGGIVGGLLIGEMPG